MDASTSPYETLGKRHKQYNELLRKTLANEESIEVQNISFDNYDRENLLKIDIASEKKDVQYILNILKSDDSLYITRALQKCSWLYSDDEFAHIINPKYLHDHLLPEMTTKGGIKLMKSIRRHLTNEKRVEDFYIYEQDIKEAIKWLPNCSVPFIEDNVKKCVSELDVKIFRRLCEKTSKVFEIVAETNTSQTFFQAAIFLLNTHTKEYLDVIEKNMHYCPKFSAHATDIIMKKTPDRIISNFENYVSNIDIPTFVNNMKTEHIKDFLSEQASKDLSDHKYYYLKRFLNSPKVMHLIKRIPKEERFEFVKHVFIDKIPAGADEAMLSLHPEMRKMQKLSQAVSLKKYEWYRFAPFDIAFEEIKKMLKIETDFKIKYSMLATLISCVRKNEKDLQSLLQYYVNNHINDNDNLKNQFVSDLINNTELYKCNNNSWQLINEVLRSMDVYIEKDHDVQNCIILIILHNVLANEDVPDVIKNKFSFNTLKRYGSKMNHEEKEKVFSFLYNNLLNKIETLSETNEIEFCEMKKIIENILTLLVDWKKELVDFPLILNKIKDIITIKQRNSWNTDLSTLYNIKKSWRKLMFEESLLLNPSEEVCINALKHDPELLLRHKNEVEKLRYDDKISLRILLSKIRIYWPESLSVNWINEYKERLNVMGGHKAVTRGLCYLVPEKSLLNIIKRYAPKEAKINWKEIDELTLSLQRNIAKNMHFARPQIDPNAIFWYAKGDFLQYTLPSLLAIFYNINTNLSQQFIPKLLDAPVSVQKHGIRFAFLRLDATRLKTIFLNIWNKSKNPTIRAELFKHTFKLLTNSKDPAKVEEIRTLLDLFIDNLMHNDEPKIFELLVRVHEVPLNIRANFLMKAYNVFKRLQPHFASDKTYRYKQHMQTLTEHSREVMESINDEFVVEIIRDYLDTEYFNSECNCTNRIMHYDGMIKVISAYLLCTKDIETQRIRYEKILMPIMKCTFNVNVDECRKSFNKENFATILNRLYKDLDDYVIDKQVIIPYKMFSNIQEELKSLPVPENYVTLTMWKLTTALTKLLSENDTTGKWEEIIVKIAPELSNICATVLKEDVTTRFSCIYVVFSRVLKEFLSSLPTEAVYIIYKGMLEDKSFVQAFLTIISVLPVNTYFEESVKLKYEEIHKIISEQPSPEVKMHYYSVFKRNIGQ